MRCVIMEESQAESLQATKLHEGLHPSRRACWSARRRRSLRTQFSGHGCCREQARRVSEQPPASSCRLQSCWPITTTHETRSPEKGAQTGLSTICLSQADTFIRIAARACSVVASSTVAGKYSAKSPLPQKNLSKLCTGWRGSACSPFACASPCAHCILQCKSSTVPARNLTWQKAVCPRQLVGVVLVPASDGELFGGSRVGKLQVGGVPVEEALLQGLFLVLVNCRQAAPGVRNHAAH